MSHPSKYREAMEASLNKWANSIAKDYKIEQNSFRISLHQHNNPQHFQEIAKVTNGAVVQITLFLPWVNKNLSVEEGLIKTVKKMKRTVRGIFKYISSPRLHNDDDFFNPLMISDVMHEYVLGENNTMVWKKKRYDPSKVHGHKKREFNISIDREVVVTFTHKTTGISYTLRDSTNRREWDLTQECWEKCSELVEFELGLREEKEEVKSLVPTQFYRNQAIHWLALTIQPENWVF